MRKIIIILLVLMVAGCATTGQEKKTDADLAPKARKLEYIIQELITLTKNSPDKFIRITINDTIARIKNKELTIVINPTFSNDILQGAAFAFRDQGKDPIIEVSPDLVDSYDKNPSLVYSILMHEFTHAVSFFGNKERYIYVKDNPLEKYFYELDAYHIEALFINIYILSNPAFKPTKFELFLAASLSKDNLKIFSNYFLGLDMSLAFYLNGIPGMKNNEKEKLVLVDDVLRKIDNIEFDSHADEEINFLKIIPLRSVLHFLPQTLYDIHYVSVHHKTTPEKFDLSRVYPDQYGKLKLLENKFIQYSDCRIQ